MPGSARCTVFILSVAATISLGTDPAAGGRTRTASKRGPAALCIYRPGGLDGRGAGTVHAECIRQVPLCRADGEQCNGSTGALLRRLRGGGPADHNRVWNLRAADGQHVNRPFADMLPPRNTWSQADYQYADGLIPFYGVRDTGAPNNMGQASSQSAASWLHELLGAEPSAAQLAGDLANGRGGRGGGLVFANHGAFAAAAKTVAFLVGSAARDPREKAWRKVRRSNPALSQRLGEQGYRLLQSCGYSIEHSSRHSEAFYLLEGVPPGTLETLERFLLAAADYGQEWVRHEYQQWLEGSRDPLLPSWRRGGGIDRSVGITNSVYTESYVPFRQLRAGPETMTSSSRVWGEGGGAGTQDGSAGKRVVYGRIFVQQRSAALTRARQVLIAALDDETESRHQSMGASTERAAGTDQLSQQADDGKHRPAAALGSPQDVANARTRQLLEITHRALTCASSTADGMYRTISAKHGPHRRGRGVVGAGPVDSGEDDQMGMVAEVLERSRHMSRGIATCQQQFAAAGQASKREMARQTEAMRSRAEVERQVEVSSQREDSAMMRCQELQVCVSVHQNLRETERAFAHASACVCARERERVQNRVRVCVYGRVVGFLCRRMCRCMYVCMYTCMYVWICVYEYVCARARGRETERVLSSRPPSGLRTNASKPFHKCIKPINKHNEIIGGAFSLIVLYGRSVSTSPHGIRR